MAIKCYLDVIFTAQDGSLLLRREPSRKHLNHMFVDQIPGQTTITLDSCLVRIYNYYILTQHTAQKSCSFLWTQVQCLLNKCDHNFDKCMKHYIVLGIARPVF